MDKNSESEKNFLILEQEFDALINEYEIQKKEYLEEINRIETLPCYQGDCPNYYGCSSKGRCGCLDYCGYDKRCCKKEFLSWKDEPGTHIGYGLLDFKENNKNFVYLGQADNLSKCKSLSQEHSFSSKIINVGSSNTNTKVVILPGLEYNVDPTPQNTQIVEGTERFPDKFSVRVETNKLYVTRTDQKTGWAQNLQLKATLPNIDSIFYNKKNSSDSNSRWSESCYGGIKGGKKTNIKYPDGISSIMQYNTGIDLIKEKKENLDYISNLLENLLNQMYGIIRNEDPTKTIKSLELPEGTRFITSLSGSLKDKFYFENKISKTAHHVPKCLMCNINICNGGFVENVSENYILSLKSGKEFNCEMLSPVKKNIRSLKKKREEIIKRKERLNLLTANSKLDSQSYQYYYLSYFLLAILLVTFTIRELIK